MTLIGGLVGLLMLFAAAIGIGLIALGIAIWWPSVFVLLAFGIFFWRVWKGTGEPDLNVGRYIPAPPPEKPARQPRGSRPDRLWIDDPDLPSSLD